MNQNIIDWLLAGDVSIQYQTYRDLVGTCQPALQQRIATEGWGAHFLKCRNPDGSWGQGFYQPKWKSTHYTLLDLKSLGIAPGHPQIRESIHQIVSGIKGDDGGIRVPKTGGSDVCVNGMFLNYASYFGEPLEGLKSIVDFILSQQMDDGGFNCQKNRSGARHSSLHSTISVLEGILEYMHAGYTYRFEELTNVAAEAREFILLHRFYRSDHTGKIIRKDLLRLSYPPRWKYNILRALDYFQMAGIPRDDRMEDALEVLSEKRRSDGRWPLQAAHPGQVHFTMEKARNPSRWNTLMALRVFQAYGY